MTLNTSTREVDVPVFMPSSVSYMHNVSRDKADHDMTPLFVRLRDYRAALDEIDRLRADRDQGAKDYCDMAERCDRQFVQIEKLLAENKRIREALVLVRSSHGMMLPTDPPQDAWKARGVDAAIADALLATDWTFKWEDG